MNFEKLKVLALAYREQKKRQSAQPKQPRTMTKAYADICAGEDPWTALGNFSNAWFGYATQMRAELVREPLIEPGQETEYTHRWAAFCAASVEFLCERYNVPCPDWVDDPSYTLISPWSGSYVFPEIRQHDIDTTYPPFKKRNIFCGNGLFRNKYEMYEWIAEAIEQGMTNTSEIHNYARQKEIAIHGA